MLTNAVAAKATGRPLIDRTATDPGVTATVRPVGGRLAKVSVPILDGATVSGPMANVPATT